MKGYEVDAGEGFVEEHSGPIVTVEDSDCVFRFDKGGLTSDLPVVAHTFCDFAGVRWVECNNGHEDFVGCHRVSRRSALV